MTTKLSRRAELALRALPRGDQDRVLAAIKRMELAETFADDWLHQNLRQLREENYLLLRAGSRIRMILRTAGDVVHLEDIVDHDLLRRYPWASLRTTEAA